MTLQPLNNIKLWKPTEEQEKYLNLIITMSFDCLMNKGTDKPETFINNIKMICDKMPLNDE